MNDSKTLLEIFREWNKERRLKKAIKKANLMHYMTGHRYWVFEVTKGQYTEPMRSQQLNNSLRKGPLMLGNGMVIKKFDYILFTKLAVYYTKTKRMELIS